MPHYFLFHDPAFLESSLLPAFTKSWRQRSFEPIAVMVVHLRPGMESFREKFCLSETEPVLVQLARGSGFDPAVWEMALGEALFFGALEAPDAPVSFQSLRHLLGSGAVEDRYGARSEWPWIDRAILGSRTFRLGRGVYRPSDAGWNREEESVALLTNLEAMQEANWQIDQLKDLDPDWDQEDLEDELALALDAFQALRQIYSNAVQKKLAVVCELIA